MSVSDNQKPTSPSPSVTRNIETNWTAGTQKGETNPQKALNDKYTRNPVDPNTLGNQKK